MATDNTIRSVEEALNRAEGIGDILNDSISQFGQNLSDCLETVGKDMSSMFEDVFNIAGQNLVSTFENISDDIKKSLGGAFDFSDLKKELKELKEEIDKLRSGRGGGGGGSGGGGSGGGGVGGFIQDLASGKKPKLNKMAVAGGILGSVMDVLNEVSSDRADANKIASEFRQIGGRGSLDTINAINAQFNTIRDKISVGSKEDFTAQYSELIQSGFTEDEVMSKNAAGENFAFQTLKSDKFLRLGAGGSAKMIGEMKTFSDEISGANAVDKLLEMKGAAEGAGVSFNKFSSAAMGIASSLRPLGLDISYTTKMLSSLSEEYRESGMSEERAFALASNNVQAMGQAFMNMDLGMLGAVAKEFGNKDLKDMFKGKDALEAGVQLRMLATGGDNIADPKQRERAMMGVMSSIAGKAKQLGGDSYERSVFAFSKMANVNEGQAAGIMKLLEKIEKGEDVAVNTAKLNKEMNEAMKTDSNNISTIAQAANSINQILASSIKMILGFMITMIAGLDSIVTSSLFQGSSVFSDNKEEGKKIRTQLLSIVPDLTSDLIRQFRNIPSIFANMALETSQGIAAGKDASIIAAVDGINATKANTEATNKLSKTIENANKRGPTNYTSPSPAALDALAGY